MKEETIYTFACEIWEMAHEENLHQHINRITGKSFRSTNTCIIYVITENPEAIESLIKEVADSWDAELSKYEDGFELLFD